MHHFTPSLARFAFLGWALATAVHASFGPDLTLITPRGGKPGTELKIHLHGERLDNPQDLLFQRPGIELLGFETGEGEKQKPLFAHIRIAPDAGLGEHLMRLRTNGGVSYLRSFWVGPFDTVDEVEPNNPFSAPQKVPLNSTVQGVATIEDEDFYSVELKKNQRLSVEVEAMRLGRIFFDAYVAVLDPKGFVIASCDDATLLRTDAFVSVVAPADGEYRVLVREAAYEGGDGAQYRLHIGDFPRPSAVFPPGAKPGETVDFHFIDPACAGFSNTITIPQDAYGLFPIFPNEAGKSPPSPNWIEVSELDAISETEPNAGPPQANPAPAVPCAVHGVLAAEADNDWFRFKARKDQNLEFRVLGRHLRSPIDSVIAIRSDKEGLANNDDLDGPDSVLPWTCPADGEYFVMVRDKLMRSGPDFTYRLEIRERQPGISASLPVAEQNNTQTRKVICVPRGGTYAVPVNISRRNLGCDVRFEALSLPAGVTMEVPPVPRALNNFPALFRAAADAPIGGGYHRFKIHATGKSAPEVSGPLSEEIHHIDINNQGAFHTSRSDLIAVAVIEKAPFRIHLESPPASLVPLGVVKLKVRVERDEGFKGKITLRMPWKPPGIGAQDTITVEPDKSEADYEVNATPEATPGDWRICILGEAETPSGPLIVSSDFVNLRVVEPWLTASIDLGATQQGIEVPVVCQLEHAREFTGTATAHLIGLPHGTKADPVQFQPNAETLTFPVTVAKDAAVGKHSGLFLQIHIPEGGSTVLHQCAQGGTLRIDPPQPVVAAADKKPEARQPDPAKPAPTADKPLSRLEQLRRQAKSE